MRVIAVDQGTTGTRSFGLDQEGRFASVASFEHAQVYPQPGWVEHDANELLSHVRGAIEAAGHADAIGIDNQGETVVAWDAATGEPLSNAIVWQDARTSAVTAKLKAEGAEELTLARAGLPLDPYFSAAKLRWFIDHVPAAQTLLNRGRLRLATSDAFFLDRLTGTFATDVTTASRTSLMNLDTCEWDDELLRLFGIPRECLPEIRATAGSFGGFSGMPVTASLVDQQAALFGHGCAAAGDAKITFGTGAFALAVAGPQRLDGSRFGILPTLAWKIGTEAPSFAIDGGVYNAASAVNWARGLGLFSSFDEISDFAAPSAITRGLAFVPALSGLACPHWDRTAGGLWIGMGLDTTRADLMQSLLEGIALRASEAVAAIAGLVALGGRISIDGGMARNRYFVQFLANALEKQVVIPATPDLTALGTARMAMRGLGMSELPPLPAPAGSFECRSPLPPSAREQFAEAIRRAKGWRR
jgi:glycerol kinase